MHALYGQQLRMVPQELLATNIEQDGAAAPAVQPVTHILEMVELLKKKRADKEQWISARQTELCMY